MHSFEYAIVRIVPRVEREEFLNVGVILYCKEHRFLDVRMHVDEKKLHAICESIDLTEVHEYLDAFMKIARGLENDSPIAKLDQPSRFRWLTATRSTILQTSKVHPGVCSDPDEKLRRLFEQYVL